MTQILLVLGGLLIAFASGIVLQRYYPIGQLLHLLGIRQWLPVVRNIPENNPMFVPNDWDVPPLDQGILHLFVLIGQSNMSGRGRLDSPDAPAPHSHVYELNKEYRWKLAREPLGSTIHEVDWIATDGGTGVGPGLAFARSLIEQDPSLRIGLIQCAHGASSIDEWQQNLSQNSLYGACLRRIRAATTYGKVAAVLVSQGESDTDDPALSPQRILSADRWAVKFSALVTALRQDINDPGLPVLFSQLGDFTSQPKPIHWDMVKRQQQQVDIPGVFMIKTDDLFLDESAHFDTASQVEIGRRFAAAYRSIRTPEY